MNWHEWSVFCGIVFFLCAIPGPNMLHVLASVARVGMARGVATMLGCLSAVVLVLVASAAGLGAALAASPHLFGVLRVCGAAYLIWLGVQAWREGGQISAPPTPAPQRAPQAAQAVPYDGAWGRWRRGFWVGLSNPKLLLFAAAFFPQFITPQAPHLPQFVVLITTFALLETLWYAIYAVGGYTLAQQLQRPSVRRVFNRITACVFVGFGAVLLRGRA
ncbi:amino acid transporter [Acetobacter aceti 1023]|nr:amino acid transporter [Acetobacter aceti 1023]